MAKPTSGANTDGPLTNQHWGCFMAKLILTPQLVSEVIAYDPETGHLFHKTRPRHLFKKQGDYVSWNKQFAGKQIRLRPGDKYIRTTIFGTVVLGHRAAWACMTGEWPKNNIDHINRNGEDNRWANLRDVPQKVNTQNVASRAKASGLPLGVVLEKNTRLKRRYRAIVQLNGKRTYVGRFETAKEAEDAYWDLKSKLHGVVRPTSRSV